MPTCPRQISSIRRESAPVKSAPIGVGGNSNPTRRLLQPDDLDVAGICLRETQPCRCCRSKIGNRPRVAATRAKNDGRYYDRE
jgi:hypothetical protein